MTATTSRQLLRPTTSQTVLILQLGKFIFSIFIYYIYYIYTYQLGIFSGNVDGPVFDLFCLSNYVVVGGNFTTANGQVCHLSPHLLPLSHYSSFFSFQ